MNAKTYSASGPIYAKGDARDAEGVAEKIGESLKQPFHISGLECVIGASVGISLYPFDAADSEAMLRKADAAMYRAKSGKNTFWRFSPEPASQQEES
jgi:GGDEF domain-containing protein